MKVVASALRTDFEQLLSDLDQAVRSDESASLRYYNLPPESRR